MKKTKTSIGVHIVFILFALACIIPFMIVVSASFTSTKDLSFYGFSIIPPKIDLSAYAYLFKKSVRSKKHRSGLVYPKMECKRW